MQGKLVKLKNEINLLTKNKVTVTGSIGLILEMKSKDNIVTVLIDGEVLSMQKNNFFLIESGTIPS